MHAQSVLLPSLTARFLLGRRPRAMLMMKFPYRRVLLHEPRLQLGDRMDPSIARHGTVCRRLETYQRTAVNSMDQGPAKIREFIEHLKSANLISPQNEHFLIQKRRLF